MFECDFHAILCAKRIHSSCRKRCQKLHYFLRVIPTLTHYFDIPSGSIYSIRIYIYIICIYIFWHFIWHSVWHIPHVRFRCLMSGKVSQTRFENPRPQFPCFFGMLTTGNMFFFGPLSMVQLQFAHPQEHSDCKSATNGSLSDLGLKGMGLVQICAGKGDPNGGCSRSMQCLPSGICFREMVGWS